MDIYYGLGSFGDPRRDVAGYLLHRAMVERPGCRLKTLGRTRAREIQFTRFLNNEHVTLKQMADQAAAITAQAAQGREVLAIQDSSDLVLGGKKARSRGFGPVGKGGRLGGLCLHAMLAVDADTGGLLGLTHLTIKNRKGGKKVSPHRTRPLHRKESKRWLEGARAASQVLAEAAGITVVADRESDIYEAWARLPDARCRLLARACRERVLADGGRLFTAADAWTVAARSSLELPAAPGREARTAKLALRFGPVEIKRPKNCSDRRAPRSQRLYLVEAREDKPPAGTAPLHWRLLVSHPITSFKQACDLIGLYRQRWHIEQLFRTMKRQGLKIEDSQIDSLHALENLIALATVAATQVMQLVNAREGSPRPATDVIDADEIATVARIGQRLEGKTQAQKNPHPEASLAWLSWIVARLGGWTGYVSERLPGPITMHNGLRRLRAILDSRQFYEDDL